MNGGLTGLRYVKNANIHKRKTKMKVQADIINGVYEVEDFTTKNILNDEDFLLELNVHKKGTIAAELTLEVAEEILKDYGIVLLGSNKRCNTI
jgi:hypothetical protein